MGCYKRQQNRRRSEATEQEALVAWCAWRQARHPELKLLYHVPNGGSRNKLEAANLKRQGCFTAVCHGWQAAAELIERYLTHAEGLGEPGRTWGWE